MYVNMNYIIAKQSILKKTGTDSCKKSPTPMSIDKKTGTIKEPHWSTTICEINELSFQSGHYNMEVKFFMYFI